VAATTARRSHEETFSVADPLESAKSARLQYVSDTIPGIRRKRAGKHFTYIGPDGKAVRDAAVRQRIRALAIPPAWSDVWICPIAGGHLQATGRDARGRKQYRYHARWREVRDEAKYERTLAFGQTLPRIRERIAGDLALPGLPRKKVLAAVVRLLEITLIRVGNDEYARDNGSFGLSTLRDRHVTVNGSEMRFRFRGKGGKEYVTGLRDRRLARVVKRCQDVPGQELFQYIDDEGETRSVGSGEVNDYIREIAGGEFTAKDSARAGTVLAAWALEELETFDSEAQAKRNVVRAIESVAERLGNTPAICRKCYVHPAVIDAYMEGSALLAMKEEVERELAGSLDEISSAEAAVLALLRERPENEAA
jgi:DNA topoisomerase-1